MITRDRARELAMEAIMKAWHISDDEPTIVDELTREEDFGWVFFWDSKLYLATNDIRHALGGNAPVAVEKDSESVRFLGTHRSADHLIADYRRERKKA